MFPFPDFYYTGGDFFFKYLVKISFSSGSWIILLFVRSFVDLSSPVRYNSNQKYPSGGI